MQSQQNIAVDDLRDNALGKESGMNIIKWKFKCLDDWRGVWMGPNTYVKLHLDSIPVKTLKSVYLLAKCMLRSLVFHLTNDEGSLAKIDCGFGN